MAVNRFEQVITLGGKLLEGVPVTDQPTPDAETINKVMWQIRNPLCLIGVSFRGRVEWDDPELDVPGSNGAGIDCSCG